MSIFRKLSKRVLIFLGILAISIGLFLTVIFDHAFANTQGAGQEGVKSDIHSNTRKIIFENARVLISEIRLKPRQKSERLTFDLPGYMYIAQSGKLRFFWESQKQDGKAQDNGHVLNIVAHHWTESEPPHTVINEGEEEFLAIRFEVKKP